MTPANVRVDGAVTGRIEKGLIVYLGIGKEDGIVDINWLAKKIVQMRIFSDEEGKMNQNVEQIEGGLLVVSQFTLFASTKKGNRPSYMASASPELAKKLYIDFVDHIKSNYTVPIETGIFAADMKVEYINDGPVTIVIDSKNKV